MFSIMEISMSELSALAFEEYPAEEQSVDLEQYALDEYLREAPVDNDGIVDALNVFLKEVHKTPLLTAEEEIDLAKRFERGDLEAKEHMVEANLRLVVKIANNPEYRHKGFTLMDLIDIGSIGLIRAVEKFDWREGYKFSTYATQWINQPLRRALARDSRTIRMAENMHTTHRKAASTKYTLTEELGREPSIEEVAAKAHIKPEKVSEAFEYEALTRPASLNKKIGEDQNSELGDFITDTGRDEGEISRYEEAHQNLEQVIDEAMKEHLDEEEQAVIKKTFLDDDKAPNYNELSQEMGVTIGTINAIRKRAVAKLGSQGGDQLRVAAGALNN
jgi:RNA polymerase primary sigma factor